MEAAYVVIPILAARVVTALFIFPVTITLELMVCQLLKWKWAHLLPVAAGILICVPFAWMTRSLYFSYDVAIIGGLRLSWIVLLVGMFNAVLGTRIGQRISQR